MRAAILLVAIALFGVAHADPAKKPAPAVVAKPGFARFMYVQGDPAPPPAVIVLAAADGRAFKITEATSDAAFIKLEQRAATNAERQPGLKGKQYVIEISLGDDAPVGIISTTVHIKTTHRKQPVVDLPVSGVVRAKPGTVADTPGSEARVVLTIEDAAGAPIADATVVASRDTLRISKTTDARGTVALLFLDGTVEYQLHVEKAGFAPLDVKLQPTPRDTLRTRYTLQAP